MRNFFYYTNLILCIGAIVCWLIQPMLGAFVHLVLGVFQAVNAVIYLVQLNKFGNTAKRMYRYYGIFVLLLIAVGIAVAFTQTDSPSAKQTIAIVLMMGSGAAAIFFTIVTYFVKIEQSPKFEYMEEEILDSDLVF